jgi:hypothetical protein
MKNIYELLRQKEAELTQLQKEIEALRIAVRLLTEDDARPEPAQFTPARTNLARIGEPVYGAATGAVLSTSASNTPSGTSQEGPVNGQPIVRQFP